ncbi:tRNA pseudouridine(13) synthase TruD [Halobacteriovorax sp. HLS]|uniref:tRNA pseudouridine(13) synthase TruD n=1 Tax=Halobacteriovorax sp. HLS TaxID=2234000 RepID=UPI000FD8158F|nr:tRNA pseudouridine(13) synthase TruD [Halobacteriovorax sp. HLS]
MELAIGGVLKTTNEDFLVEEIPLYLPSNEGQHIYLLIKRSGLSTKEIVDRLKKIFKVHETDIGFAGLKDKNATVTQWFSLSLGANAQLTQVQQRIEDEFSELTILEISKHTNKLKNSHLIGNKFTLTLRDCKDGALETANLLKNEILKNGIPNYYGPQRFGSKQTNQLVGKEILLKTKKEKRHWVRKLMLSAYQSHLFNIWLSKRINNGQFSTLVEGDLLQSTQQQRPFPFDPLKEHIEEFKRGEISFTGPMYGAKVSTPSSKALEIENEILELENVTMENFTLAKLPGSRRLAHIFLNQLDITATGNDITLSFTLSKGSYATSLVREFSKNDH